MDNKINDGFYHGYEQNDKSDSPYNQSSYDASKQMEELMSSYKIENPSYEDFAPGAPAYIKGYMVRNDESIKRLNRLFPSPDNIANSINDRSQFQKMYPSARIATVSDAFERSFFLIFLGLVIIFPFLVTCIDEINTARYYEDLIAEYTTTEGIIARIGKGDTSIKGTVYTVYYDYTYNNQEYSSYSFVYKESLDKLDIDPQNAKGHPVTVYLDKEHPKQTMLAVRLYPPFFLCLIIAIGFIPIIPAVIFLFMCKNGKYIVFYSKDIRHFKRVSEFIS